MSARAVLERLQKLEGGPHGLRTEHTAGLELAIEVAEEEAKREGESKPRPALDALCSDHRRAWTTFAAAALQTRTMIPLDTGAELDMLKASTDRARELVVRKHRHELVAGAAEWADMMTEEWKKRFGS